MNFFFRCNKFSFVRSFQLFGFQIFLCQPVTRRIRTRNFPCKPFMVFYVPLVWTFKVTVWSLVRCFLSTKRVLRSEWTAFHLSKFSFLVKRTNKILLSALVRNCAQTLIVQSFPIFVLKLKSLVTTLTLKTKNFQPETFSLNLLPIFLLNAVPYISFSYANKFWLNAIF